MARATKSQIKALDKKKPFNSFGEAFSKAQLKKWKESFTLMSSAEQILMKDFAVVNKAVKEANLETYFHHVNTMSSRYKYTVICSHRQPPTVRCIGSQGTVK